MTDATDTTNFQPPYMSWATFDNIVEQFRSVGLPARIDRSVLSSRSGGDQSQFLRAAGAFGLIADDGTPTERLRAYVADPDSRPNLMAEMLREAYPEVIALPGDATSQMLTDEFRKFGIEGETVRKAIAFYLNAARFAGLPLSPHFKATRPGAGGRKSAKRGQRKSSPGSDEQNETDTATPPDPFAGLHPAIVTLVQSLPPVQQGEKVEFPEADREAWFAYATATFNLIYARTSSRTAAEA